MSGEELLWGALGWAVDRLSELEGPPAGELDGQGRAEGWAGRAEGWAGRAEGGRPDASQDHDRYRRWLAARTVATTTAAAPEAGGVGGVRAGRRRAGRRPPPGIGPAPCLSVVVPVFRPDLWFARRCVESVRAQSWPSWELCLCDDGSGDRELTSFLRGMARRDRRIRLAAHPQNLGISSATNRALGLASGDFVALLDHDDELVPHALASVAEAIHAHPEADVLYSDEDKLDQDGLPFGPRFKPDWSPDYLLTTPYLGHLLVVRRTLVDQLGGMRPEMDGSQDYDLMLRATESARSVVHIPEVLYHWRVVAGSAAGDATAKPWAYAATGRALASALARRGDAAELEPGPMPGMWHVRRPLVPGTSLTVVVVSSAGARELRRCVDGLGGATGVGMPHVVVASPPGPDLDLETEALLGSLAERPEVRVVTARQEHRTSARPGGWAALANAGSRAPGGGHERAGGGHERAGGGHEGSGGPGQPDGQELLVLLDARVEPPPGPWLRAMAEHALRPDVGPIGARLLSPEGRVHHVGLVLGLGGDPAGAVLAGLGADELGYLEAAGVTRNWSAVSGACLVIRRSLFDRLGGLDEAMGDFADVDLCLRAGQAGYRAVVTPLAELVVRLPSRRGRSGAAAFWARWGDRVRAGDPYFSPNLSRLDPYCVLADQEEEDIRWSELTSTPEPSPGGSRAR